MNNKEIINTEIIYDEKEANKIVCFMIILASVTIILVLILYFLKYDYYYYNKVIVYKENEDLYLKMYVNIGDLNKVVDNKDIYIGDVKTPYEIVYINNNDYIVTESYNNYQEILLKSNILEEHNIENNILDISIKYKTVNLLYYVFKIFKGG